MSVNDMKEAPEKAEKPKAHLLKTQWNQRCVYAEQCPFKPGKAKRWRRSCTSTGWRLLGRWISRRRADSAARRTWAAPRLIVASSSNGSHKKQSSTHLGELLKCLSIFSTCRW
mmetsp:Transcript_17118/g.25305  ORF Transcript_17118/g.25305 Transcript_17118/m.25305 type:complete len:113 (-) Transcript_17118:196-534(-)